MEHVKCALTMNPSANDWSYRLMVIMKEPDFVSIPLHHVTAAPSAIKTFDFQVCRMESLDERDVAYLESVVTTHDPLLNKIQPQHVENCASVDRCPSRIR